MNISKRRLTKWRKEALKEYKNLEGWDSVVEMTESRRSQADHIIQMTQELLDQHLLNETNK